MSDRARQDIVAGTVRGPETRMDDQAQHGSILLTIETFGTEGRRPSIQAYASWNPLETEWPGMADGDVMRFWGCLDRETNRMELTWAQPAGREEFSVLGCGGRDFRDYRSVEDELDLLQPDQIVHGAARGADSLVGRYARENRIECLEFNAIWRPRDGLDPETLRPLRNGYNPRAGFQRNGRMLRESRPDLVVAFPGGNGTAHMVRTARGDGYRVLEVPERGEPRGNRAF